MKNIAIRTYGVMEIAERIYELDIRCSFALRLLYPCMKFPSLVLKPLPSGVRHQSYSKIQ